mgnify:CR=1 FL=1
MNKKEKEFLEEIYNDCIKLKRKNDLTEYGAGQGALASVLLKKKLKKLFKTTKKWNKIRTNSTN